MKKDRIHIRNLVSHTALTLFSIVMVYPVLWWIGASFKTPDQLGEAGLFPASLEWGNYVNGWNALPNYTFAHFFGNSIALNAATTILTVISCSLVAFGFARLEFPLKKLWFAVLMMTLMLPGQITLIPQYAMFHSFDWINTYLPLVVPSMFGSAFFIFLLIQFIRGLPKELDESAKIDGCSWYGIFWKIVLPLCKSSLVTVVIFSFLWSWDDYFGPLLYLNSIGKYTVPIALGLFVDSQSGTQWGELLAMSLLSIVPQVVVFFAAQRHFLEGIATTGLKG